MAFKEIAIEELGINPFTKIGKEWLLITAGDENGHNTMTASWGGLGIMWGKNVATIYIRPQRYTKEFVDNNDRLTLTFYDEEYRKALSFCGTKSGRDHDKDKEAGLTPYYVDGITAYEEANMVLVCRKQYHQEMRPECFDVVENDAKWYPAKDYHTMYIVEIEKVLVKDSEN
ncbi:MAG: flavin reductase [Ruminococcus sp.]|nr:flavin reductase [Ruminococcus sp.]